MFKWPKNLVLIRHGESEHNLERFLIGAGKKDGFSEKMKNTRNADISLTKKGIKQAEKTGEFLRKEYKNFDAVFISPFKRAQETALRILDAWKNNAPKMITEERIREKEFGIFHAFTKQEIKEKYPEWHHLKEIEGKYYYRPPGGESYPDIALRIHSFLGTLTRDYSKKNVLVVSHSAVLLMFHKLLTRMTEEEILKLDKENEIKNCGIIAYALDSGAGKEGKMAPRFFNKISY